MSNETAIRQLMTACEKDPELFKRLVSSPAAVATEYGVTLEPAEIEQLGRVQKLQNLVDEFKVARPGVGGPIKYPIDVAWKTALTNHIIYYRPIYYPIFYPIYYPIFYQIGYPVVGYTREPTAQARALRKVAAKKRP
ncbi:MAG TPA: hypothetical protein VME23_05225 [Terracidiphilus sp.]|nr:hypothetical protein [Terracidiphilus sp.]